MANTATIQVASSERVVPGSINVQVAPWPVTPEINPETTDVTAISSKIIDSFNQALRKKDYRAIADLFVDNGYWRDRLGLTWDLRTAKGKERIVNFLQNNHHLVSVVIDQTPPNYGPKIVDLRYDGSVRGIRFFTTVTTQFGSGSGVAHLVQESGQWKIWAFFTSMERLKDHAEATGANRSHGVVHGARAGRKNVSCL